MGNGVWVRARVCVVRVSCVVHFLLLVVLTMWAAVGAHLMPGVFAHAPPLPVRMLYLPRTLSSLSSRHTYKPPIDFRVNPNGIIV